MQHQKDGQAPETKADRDHEESLEASLRQSEQHQKSAWNKTKNYLNKGENWIAVASLAILAVYAAVTLGLWLAQLRANRINSAIYVASSRPWITLTDIKPASLDSDDIDGVMLWVDISVKNVGHSPAQSVSVYGKLMIDQFDPRPDLAMESACQESRTLAYPGSPIFPDQTGKIWKDVPNSFWMPAEHVWAARNARIKSAFYRGNTGHAQAWAQELSKFPFYAALYFVGCINYGSVDKGPRYQTSFMFDLSLKPDGSGFPLLSGEPVNDMPPTPHPDDPEVLVVHPRQVQRIVQGNQIRIGTPLYGTFAR